MIRVYAHSPAAEVLNGWGWQPVGAGSNRVYDFTRDLATPATVGPAA